MSESGHAQRSEIDKLKKTADDFFDNEEYQHALPIYLSIDSIETDYYVKYQIGACYLNTRYSKQKALPFLEEAVQDPSVNVPVAVYRDLGILYHLTNQFDLAIENFNHFIGIAEKNNKSILFVKRMIEICQNAKSISTIKTDAIVQNLGYPINTRMAEYKPMISSDETVLYFVREDFENDARDFGSEFTEKTKTIMVSVKDGNVWSEPKPLEFSETDKNKTISLAGLSPDGQMLFFNVEVGDNTDIFYCIPINYAQCKRLIKLNSNVNSKFNEGSISITADGKELYFSSNRPGGFGLMDLYKTELDESGDWGPAVNLGSVINSPYNEGSPFIHPDNKTLYFSSQGHTTIGGYDIFKTTKINNSNTWEFPVNIGFPNTTQDDMDFVLSASGQMGYFSSRQNNNLNRLHIYSIDLKHSIPLTMVKGKILAGNPLKPIWAKIRVLDNQTHELVKYVYNPNPENGKYLLIFPPAKNYDLIIEAPGFLPQMINIYIPDQTYFYELFQEIQLIPIKALGKVVGEEIFIKNTFYDVYKTSMADSITKANLAKSDKDYVKLIQLVEDIIYTTDSMAADVLSKQIPKAQDSIKPNNSNLDALLKLIEQAIETTDSVALEILSQNTVYDENAQQTYFYPANKEVDKQYYTIVGNDTIYTSKPIDSRAKLKSGAFVKSSELTSMENSVIATFSMKMIPENQRKLILTFDIFYSSNSSIIDSKYFPELTEINKLVVNNPYIGLEINGYADSVGDATKNLILSQERAKFVFDFFIDKGITPKKAVIRAHGEKFDNSSKNENNRKVVIKVYEVLLKD